MLPTKLVGGYSSKQKSEYPGKSRTIPVLNLASQVYVRHITRSIVVFFLP